MLHNFQFPAMSLTPDSITKVLQHLDPHLDTLQTGFPTSTRPNEPVLTKDQKKQKIKATLAKDPGIFLTKWGSVILYQRPAVIAEWLDGGGSQVEEEAKNDSRTAKDILDLFAPLAGNYEIKYQLKKLYQQLQQLSEHASFKASQPSDAAAASQMRFNDMEIDPQRQRQQAPSSSFSQEDVPAEERKPEPAQSDLFTRSIVSQNTRRNRRLNYLLRHLAPPDPSEFVDVAGTKPVSTTAHATSHSSTSNNRGRNSDISSSSNTSHEPHPVQEHHMASILSISGSMSNLSFSESTYFSDAEMEARAPELYQQYIGRFMDNDEEEEGEEEEDVGEDEDADDSSDTVEEDGGNEGHGERLPRRQSRRSAPFSKDVGLVDRILWGIDHPTRKQQKSGKNQGTRESDPKHRPTSASAHSTHQQRQYQQLEERSRANQPHIHVVASSSTAAATSVHPPGVPVRLQDSESEFEEEFDSESEVEDSEMAIEEPDKKLVKQAERHDGRKGPLKDLIADDDDIRASMSVTPRIPPEPLPGLVSSTFASAAMTLEQPEERALFAHVENGNDSDSGAVSELNWENEDDREKELDSVTAHRKEGQEALRREFVLLMKQRFLDGLDRNFDYSTVDFDEGLDDLEQENHDQEDRWFDEDEDEDMGDEGARETTKSRLGLSSFDERLRAWEESAQNGSGDYDY